MIISTRLVLSAVALLGLMPLANAAAEEPPFTGVINADNVNIRANAGDNYYVVLQIDRGEIVEVREEMFGWYQIVPPDDTFSYISMAFVNTQGDGSEGVVNANRVRVRAPSPAGPSKSYRTQLTLHDGDRVEILGEEDGYYKIKPPEGALLSVSAEYVDVATDEQIAAARGEQVASDPEPRQEPEDEPEVADADDNQEETDADRDAEPEQTANEDDPDAADDDEADEDADAIAEDDNEDDDENEPRPLVSRLAIDADGQALYEGEPLDEEALDRKLAQLVDEFDSLTLHVARDARYSRVSAVMDRVREAGFDDVEVRAGDPPAVASANDADDDDERDEPLSLDDATEQVPGPTPVVLEQNLEADADEASADADDDDEEETPLTFDELERRYRQISEMPLRQQPIGELRMDYEQLRVTGDLNSSQRRMADARIEILSMRHELQASLLEIASVEQETQEATQRREEEDAARPKQYAAVGRLSTSTLYTGEKLPLLYRVVDPATGRTVAYVQPGDGVDPVNLIGDYVGVVGRRDFNGSLGLYIVTAESIDELTADAARQR